MAHYLNIRQLFLSVFMIILVLFTFDGPLFGTEELFSALRGAQVIVFAMAAWALATENSRVQRVVSLATFAGVSSVAIIRFSPG